jgi:hypothetical protein
MFDLELDSKLRACDLVTMRMRDICHGEHVAPRATVMQQKNSRPVQFEITQPTRDALGLAVSVASCSKPMVAFTKSRKISRAVSGSPLRNSVAASSSSACANEASLCTRWMTVSLKFLVNAILLPLVLNQQCLGFIDVPLLTAFVSTTDQDGERFAIFGEVNPVAWSPVNDIFTHAVKPLNAERIAQSHSKFGNGHLGCCLSRQAVKPLLVRVGCILTDVLFVL